MLIQVQKSKVDVGAAMLALDKLLQSNELNFELVALLPLLGLLYLCTGAAAAYTHRLRFGRYRDTIEAIKGALHSIEHVLLVGAAAAPSADGRSDDDDDDDCRAASSIEGEGEMLVLVQRILDLFEALPETIRRAAVEEDILCADLTDLLSSKAPRDKLWVVMRMYHYYPFLSPAFR